jgi:hypothetical protein
LTRAAVAAALTLAAACLVYDPSAPASDCKRVAILLVVILALAWHAPQRLRVPLPSYAVAGLSFLGVSAASLSWGESSGARDLATLFAAGCVGLLSALGWASAVNLVGLLVGGSTGFVVLVSALMGGRGFALHAGQGNPNWAGLLLAVTLPLSIAATRDIRSQSLAIGCAVAASSELPALYLTHSRVAWVAAFAAACLWGLVAIVRRKGGSGATVALAAVIAIGVIAVAAGTIVLPWSTGRTGEATQTTEASADVSLRGRIWIWRASAQAAKTSLPFGSGLGSFSRHYLDAQGELLSGLSPARASRLFVNATTAHNEYLQVAIESGPLALVLFVVTLALAARARALERADASLASIVVVSVCAVGDSPLRQPALMLVVGLLLAPRVGPPRVLPRSVIPVVLVFASLLLFLSTRTLLAARWRTAALTRDPAGRIHGLKRASQMDPTSGEAAVDLGVTLLASGDADGAERVLLDGRTRLADLALVTALGEAQLAKSDLVSAVHSFSDALSWDPGSVRARVGLGEAERRAGNLERAREAWQVASTLAPFDPRVRALGQAVKEDAMDVDPMGD